MEQTFFMKQKKNLKYMISYFCFLLFFLAGALFYRQSFLAILLILLFLLPFLSVYSTYFMAHHVKIEIKPETSSVESGYPLRFQVCMKNPTFLPLLNCEFSFHYENLFYPRASKDIFTLPSEPRKDLFFHLTFDTNYAGMMRFSFSSLYITDFLHLYTFEIPIERTYDIPVLPKETPYPEKIDFPKQETDLEEEESTAFLGQPTNEIKEIREYIPGDRLQNIHWKMSAKADDLLVKELEHKADHYPALLPELYKNELQDTIATLYSLSLALLAQREFFQILIFSASDKSFTPHLITNKETLLQAILALYFESSYPVPHYAYDCYISDTDGECSILYIDGCKVQKEGNL